MKLHWHALAFLPIAVLCVPAVGQDQNQQQYNQSAPPSQNQYQDQPARPEYRSSYGQGRQSQTVLPGTVNYVEGSASLDGEVLNRQSIGSAGLDVGHHLSTGNGKAEILLTPGIFLRLDSNSSVRLDDDSLQFTGVMLEHGRASIEVDEIYPQNDVQIAIGNVAVQLQKVGFYILDADHNTARTFVGEAAAHINNKWVEIKQHKELVLSQTKTHDFPSSATSDELYQWSSLRSQYLADANQQMAARYGYGYAAPGWYWDPYLYGYTYFGAYPFYSPFGWGFYPFGWGFGGYYGGYYGWRGGYGWGGYHPGPPGGYHPSGGYVGGGAAAGGSFHGGGVSGGGHGGGGGGHR